jgi:hypothetical protein
MIPVVVVLSGRPVLRIYQGDAMVIETPITRKRALVLVADLANALLLPEISAGEGTPEIRAWREGRARGIVGGCKPSGVSYSGWAYLSALLLPLCVLHLTGSADRQSSKIRQRYMPDY